MWETVMNEKVAIILVNYNGKQFNNSCIQSILKSTVKEDLIVVVVDNASNDDSLQDLKMNWGEHSQVHVISLDDNYGFSKANNIGICWAMEQGIEKYILLNNDTEIGSEAIENMLQCQTKHKGIIVPKILFADKPDIIWYAGGKLSSVIRKPIPIGFNQKDTEKYNGDYKCDFANGCCMLLTKEIVDHIGYLDERFFLYYEDTEYSLRAEKNQIEIWYCGSAVVYHKVNGSTKGNENPLSVYYITRNWLLCNSIYLKGRLGLFYFYFILNRLAWVGIWLLKGKVNMLKMVWKGIRDYHKCSWGCVC